MGYLEVSGVGYRLPDGRPLLHEVSFRVGEGAKTALIGANGCGKTTLLTLIDRITAPRRSVRIGGWTSFIAGQCRR